MATIAYPNDGIDLENPVHGEIVKIRNPQNSMYEICAALVADGWDFGTQIVGAEAVSIGSNAGIAFYIDDSVSGLQTAIDTLISARAPS